MKTHFESKILVVDDEEDLIDVIELVLLQQNIQVISATSALDAIALLKENHFDLILCDYRMPNMSGTQLHSWVKKNTPTPFVLMSASSEVSSPFKAHKLDVDGFLQKPFSFNDLKLVMDRLLNKKTTKQDSLLLHYSKIPIDHFFNQYKTPFVIFSATGEQTVKKIAQTGDEISHQELNEYKKDGVDFFYILKNDFIPFIEYQLKLTKGYIQSKETTDAKKVQLASNISEDIFNKVYLDGLNKELFDHAVSVIKIAIETIATEERICHLIEVLKKSDAVLYNHSIKVSAFSVMVANKLNIKDKMVLQNIALGAFFHDIGELHFDFNSNGYIDVEDEYSKQNILNGHCEKGHRVLSVVENIDDLVLSIILTHENLYETSKKECPYGNISAEHIVAVVNKLFCILDEWRETPLHVRLAEIKNEKHVSAMVTNALSDLIQQTRLNN